MKQHPCEHIFADGGYLSTLCRCATSELGIRESWDPDVWLTPLLSRLSCPDGHHLEVTVVYGPGSRLHHRAIQCWDNHPLFNLVPVETPSRREKGVDMKLAMRARDWAEGPPKRGMVLITGDADFVPLVESMQSRGVSVIVPEFNVPGVGKSDRLYAAASHVIKCQLGPYQPNGACLF